MIYYVQGSAIVSTEEIFETPVLDSLSSFYTDLSKGKKPRSVMFSTGELTPENALMGFDSGEPAGRIGEFKPIGLGLPLTVMIREVYTGRYPKNGLFGGGHDMLLTSAIKSIAFGGAKPRAINFLMNKVSANRRIERPPASTQGTPIIFYSPALLEISMTMDLAMVFDTFPKETFDQVGDTFNAAAGIPVFQVYGVYLLAAGMLTKLLGQAGEAVFDGKPVFDSSGDALDIALPGSPAIQPGFVLITSDNVDLIDKDFRSKYQINTSGKVVDDTGKAYNGDIPYIVISLDGTPQDAFASFSPTAACAAILSRFYGIKDGQQLPLNILIDGMKLYNDVTYRRQIDRIDKQLKALPATDPKRAALQKKRDALSANILEVLLKP